MDEIRISVPRERGFGPVAGLVIGGVAARHDLTIDVLDDLQLAIETLLEREESEEEVTIVLRIDAGVAHADVGPFRPETVSELHDDLGESIGLRRLLETLMDDVSLGEREDGCWVSLRKATTASEEAA